MTAAKAKDLRRLGKLLPGEIIFDTAILKNYAGDKWFAAHQPDAVARPRSAKSVATILRFANKNKIPVTATLAAACRFVAGLCFHSNA
jgi:FAD/FMN-containing dehydrogenase